MTIKTKDDVELRGGNPAVNVKVYKSIRDVKLPICLGGSRPANEPDKKMEWAYTDPEFDVEWVEDNVEEGHFQFVWDLMCQMGWEWLQDAADQTWPEYSPKVYSEGRSGGWAVVHNLPDVDSWDAVMLSLWRRFAKIARAAADDIPHQTMVSIYMNEFEEEDDAQA